MKKPTVSRELYPQRQESNLRQRDYQSKYPALSPPKT